MQEQRFLIKDFDLLPGRNAGALFYTPEISAHVTHAKVVELLSYIRLMHEMKITESQLDLLITQFSLEIAPIKKYLVRGLKVMVPQDDFAFKKLFLLIDDDFIRDIIERYFQLKSGVTVFAGDDLLAVDEDSLVLFFKSQYLPEHFDEVRVLASERDAWLMTSYIANEYLVIDNLYHARKGVPCHFCNYHRHQNLVMSTNAVKKTSWLNFCRKTITEEVEFFPAISLSEVEKSMIAYWLAHNIKSFVGCSSARLFMNEVAQYSWINLLSGERNQEQSVHWSFCECLQKGEA